MLPFMKPKAMTGLIISKRKPDDKPEETHSEGNENQGLEAAAEDLIRAVHSKDAKAVAAAMRAAFEICGSYEAQEDGAESVE